jgi:hypothetical protein
MGVGQGRIALVETSRGAGGMGADVNELEDVLGLATTHFVDRYVRSLLTWDVLVFFHRNPDAVLDMDGLAARLGRSPEDLHAEVDELCRDRILQRAGGLVRYRPEPEMRDTVESFANACQDRGRRLALIALVLHKINPREE